MPNKECPICGRDEWEEEDGLTICSHCGYEMSDTETDTYCENCGLPIKVGDLIIDQASGSMSAEGPNIGDHSIMHTICPDDELEAFKEKRIKELLEFEFENFKPQYICECVDEDLEPSMRVTTITMWPKADITDEFDEMRFILEYGVNMGELGKIPKDWKAYRDCNTSDHEKLRKRADKYLKKLSS